MPPKKVPCFSTNGLAQSHVAEFDRQLSGQESGLNSMTVEEYLNGRSAFVSGTAVRDPNIARRERTKFQKTLKLDLIDQYRGDGLGAEEADKKASDDAAEKMRTLAALHNPDMVAGGRDTISCFGNCNVNKRIGAQWNKGDRLANLDRAAAEIPETARGSTKMNASDLGGVSSGRCS